jgi:tetratricopeptide (TPR) repeat protein
MAVKGEPSYAELVYDVVQSADRPLTFQEIVEAVGRQRRVPTKNPKATVRGALTSARQIMSDGQGHYDYLPRMISGSLLRLPLAEKKPANHPLIYTDEARHALWPSFGEGEKRSDRRPVPTRLEHGAETALSLEFLGTGIWGCAMPEPIRAYLVDQRAQAGDALLIRIAHGERQTCEIQFEAQRHRDSEAVAARNGELADAAERFLKERRASDAPIWDLVIALLARGAYKAGPAPDTLVDVLGEDSRFAQAGFHIWTLTAALTPARVAEIEQRKQAEREMYGLLGGRDELDGAEVLPPLPFPVGGGSPLESIFADIQRLMGSREFASDDEAQEYLEQILTPTGAPGAAATVGAGGRVPAETPLDRAQDVMYTAWQAQSPRQRERLARQALTISPDCADAYVLLGNEVAQTAEEAADFYAQGIAAGERALGPDIFEEGLGSFWGLLETRPYMRARLGLAQALWAMERPREAIEHLQAMLRLNPGDNQGVRYLLLSWLLDTGDDLTAERLIADYDDDAGASWSYGATLVSFRLHGDSPAARKLLAAALEVNPYVPSFLLGRKRLPKRLPGLIGFGDESEAIMCASEQIEAWRATPGALTWLMAATRRGKR